MSTETHTVMDTPKLDAKLATPTKEIGYVSIGLALYTRGGNNSQRHGHGRTGYGKKTDEEMDEETDDIRNTSALNANQIVIQPNNAERGSAPRLRAKLAPPENQGRISQHRNDRGGYQAPYETPYDMLNAFGKGLQGHPRRKRTQDIIKLLYNTYGDSDASKHSQTTTPGMDFCNGLCQTLTFEIRRSSFHIRLQDILIGACIARHNIRTKSSICSP
ncbi:hypothetical protein BDD12DRAFT_881551 [Trichophaea hybrida]|nr:hypothetical protein BDD12DRAFT_881551 [Trichophaea hybrida]